MKSVYSRSFGAFGAAACVMLAGAFSVAQAATPFTGVASTPVSAQRLVTPYIIPGDNEGGNRTCADVGAAFFEDAEYYQFESPEGGEGGNNYTGGSFEQLWPAGLTVNTDGKYVSFSSSFPIGAVIVKGSNDANVYVYEPQVSSDTGLASPPNASGNFAGLSNLRFCWNPPEDDDEPCWTDETAWAAGAKYVSRGNWATYTPYAANATVTLFAGQTLEAGTVTFGPVANGEVEITITLNPGFRFLPSASDEFGEPVDNNVKIQDYAVAPPAQNPSPGLFAHKFYADPASNTWSGSVPANNFYGVHVDIEREVACPTAP
jgi:hypothetical protein